MTATNRGTVRQPFDHYATPPWLTEAVLPLLQKRLEANGDWPYCKVLEPACGPQELLAGALRNQWPAAEVDASDLIAPWSADFLKMKPRPIYDLIITNPPFCLAQEFCNQAAQFKRTPESLVVMLLRVNFLGTQKRAKWLRANMPSVAITPRRPSFIKDTSARTRTDSTEYGWFIWPKSDPMLVMLETE